MADIQSAKNHLIGLSYTDKIEISEWLHKQIDFERAEEVKRKSKEVSSNIDSFLGKAIAATKTGANNIMDQFKKATNQEDNNKSNLPEKH